MRIIFDLDDTLCTAGTDFENARPKIETIKKLKQLNEAGNEIFIYTSRGQLSCNGNLQAIETKYRRKIENWLKEAGIPFDVLLFGKPLGDIYIDDKGISLDEFLSGEYKELSGNSGSVIYKAGNRVIKTCKDAKTQAEWYEKANNIGINTPRVISVVSNTISIDFINGESGNTKQITCADINHIISLIMLMSLYPATKPFDTGRYYQFIIERLKIAKWENEFSHLLEYLHDNEKILVCNSTFSHGDLTLSNTIFSKNGLFLIDPSSRTEFSSFLNDFAKLSFSLNGGEQLLHGGKRPTEYEDRLLEMKAILSRNGWNGIVSAMEAVHWIRMLGYFSQKDDIQTIWRKAKELEASI